MKKLLGLYAVIYCSWVFGWRCFLVIIRSLLRKKDRTATNRYLNEGGIKLLKGVRANYQFHRPENFKYIDNLPRIYMSNHLSLFDTPLFYATINDTIRIVTKKELATFPLVGRAIINAEHAIVDRKAVGQNQDFFIDAKNKLRDGIALWFFPEGTRSRNGELLPFKMGGFKLACEIGAQIIPVGIIGTNHILPADSFLPNLNKKLKIRLGEPIDTRMFQSPELLMQSVNEKIRGLCVNDLESTNH